MIGDAEYRLNVSLRNRIGAIPLKHLFTTLEYVVKLIRDGVYDFYTLPKKMKSPMTQDMKEKINGLPRSYQQG